MVLLVVFYFFKQVYSMYAAKTGYYTGINILE
ncbi:hypothetical protein C3B55_00641 [Candidatus Pseudomonas adelgestsugas]|uniref:Uncharacterized protein n=1 Tax=Candidatus Pseudomonas adelgestsugas TaxID=1302376 RepID=A0ABX5R9H8_9PSED|nr:hypothetical protein C3B55_00641 [Candidatus Pseudomonas adelgestsugas]